jgi:hypothetical protein
MKRTESLKNFFLSVNIVTERSTDELNRLLHVARPHIPCKSWSEWLAIMRTNGYIITCHDELRDTIVGVIAITPIHLDDDEKFFYTHFICVDKEYSIHTRNAIMRNLMQKCNEKIIETEWDDVPPATYCNDICDAKTRRLLQKIVSRHGNIPVLQEVMKTVRVLSIGTFIDQRKINDLVNRMYSDLPKSPEVQNDIPLLRKIIYGTFDRATLFSRH